MSKAVFVERMRAFALGEGTYMNRVAGAYSADEVDLLADYFAAQEAPR